MKAVFLGLREKERRQADKDSKTKTCSQLFSYTSLAAVTVTVLTINNANGSSIPALISGNCRKAWRVIRAQRLCSFSESETGQGFSVNHVNITLYLTYKVTRRLFYRQNKFYHYIIHRLIPVWFFFTQNPQQEMLDRIFIQ